MQGEVQVASGRGLRNKVSLVAALALLASAFGAIAPPPASASYYEAGVSFSGRIVRGSVSYALNVKAVEAMGFTRSLKVSISKLRDPDGPTRLRQRQTWIFELEEGEFYRDGDAYHIDAGSNAGPFRVKVIVEPREDARCSRRQQLFVTKPEGGAFRIETGNETFGTISELPRCGKPWSYSSGERPGPPPCPVNGRELQSAAITVKARRDSDGARINVFNARSRNVAGHQVEWYVQLRGTVAPKRFRLNRYLEGSVRGEGAPWLDGTAWFNPNQTVVRADWFDCRRNREALSVERGGAITGTLTLNVIGYERQAISDADALARRSWVRART